MAGQDATAIKTKWFILGCVSLGIQSEYGISTVVKVEQSKLCWSICLIEDCQLFPQEWRDNEMKSWYVNYLCPTESWKKRYWCIFAGIGTESIYFWWGRPNSFQISPISPQNFLPRNRMLRIFKSPLANMFWYICLSKFRVCNFPQELFSYPKSDSPK